MKKIAIILSLLSLSATKSADQVFKGNSPGVAGHIACSDGADDAQWFSPISTNCGVAVSSNTPTATGNVLCATSAVTAQFESPSACGLATAPLTANSASITTTVSAQSCATIATVSVPGAALGKTCATSATSTTGTGWQLSISCGVLSAGSVIIRACNPTTSGISISGAVLPVRVSP